MLCHTISYHAMHGYFSLVMVGSKLTLDEIQHESGGSGGGGDRKQTTTVVDEIGTETWGRTVKIGGDTLRFDLLAFLFDGGGFPSIVKLPLCVESLCTCPWLLESTYLPTRYLHGRVRRIDNRQIDT